MKNLRINFLGIALAMMAFSVAGCSDQMTNTDSSVLNQEAPELDFSDMQIDLDLDLNFAFVIYDKSIHKPMAEQIKENIRELMSDVLDESQDEKYRLTNFDFKTAYRNGNIVITEYSYFDRPSNKQLLYSLSEKADHYDVSELAIR